MAINSSALRPSPFPSLPPPRTTMLTLRSPTRRFALGGASNRLSHLVRIQPERSHKIQLPIKFKQSASSCFLKPLHDNRVSICLCLCERSRRVSNSLLLPWKRSNENTPRLHNMKCPIETRNIAKNRPHLSSSIDGVIAVRVLVSISRFQPFQRFEFLSRHLWEIRTLPGVLHYEFRRSQFPLARWSQRRSNGWEVLPAQGMNAPSPCWPVAPTPICCTATPV